jgi:hypothetical protein
VRVQTSSLSLKDDSTPPANPGLRKLSFRSSTRSDAPANRIVPPAPLGGGDPRGGGGTLDVYNSAGSGERVTIALPGSGWTALGSGTNPKGYRFRGSGAIASLTVKADRIVIKGGGATFGYTLDEASQGSVAVRLRLGTALPWCAEAGRAPSLPRVDEVDRFLAQPKTPPPAVCPPLP